MLSFADCAWSLIIDVLKVTFPPGYRHCYTSSTRPADTAKIRIEKEKASVKTHLHKQTGRFENQQIVQQRNQYIAKSKYC